ncbi:hypothetical protein B0I35DRAFT_46595 [Stachybotrys elegans]|uniref:AMP-dependent synthetase/ligase domain-containing protein n=1 Tax=Stachybotrys elegans TaxID=80388 RepID=A0A8K0T573_9HYPO|nr:hypothetical protein B0I35DRAFT_46595 [Stachybotrys elegans]
MAADKKMARVGAPQAFASTNTFDWLFSNPLASPTEYPLESQRVPAVPDSRPIFVDNPSDRTLTYGRLRQDALALGAGLQALGLNPDNLITLPPTPTCSRPEIAPVVVIQLPNTLQFATVVLGTLAAGCTASLVSPALTAGEIAWVLQNSRPSVIIAAKSCMPAMQEAIKAQADQAFFAKVPVFSVDVAGDAYPQTSAAPPSDWKQLLVSRGNTLRKPIVADPALRAAVILWSSGTSGKSKGVLLSHHALNFSVASLWHDADFYQGQQQRFLGYVPFYHVFGLVNTFLLAVCAGATVYTMTAFKLDAMLASIPKRKITYLHMAPPIAVMLAKSPLVEPYEHRDAQGRNAFSTIAAAVTGGAPLGWEVIEKVYDRLGFRIRMGYGLTETCSTSMQRGLTAEEMRAQRGDTGHPHWGVEIMIAADASSASESTRAAAEGAEGEILIRSPCLMMGYLPTGGLAETSKPDMSVSLEALTPDGWFRTGDVGMIDKAGGLHITDRLKELIKVRGFQVAPAELEAILCASEDVADAGVIGIHDKDDQTELPRAFVVPAGKADGPEKLKELAHKLRVLVETHTARYKWLKGGIVFVDQIPKSPSGKILRRVLRDGVVKGVEVSVYEPQRRPSKL